MDNYIKNKKLNIKDIGSMINKSNKKIKIIITIKNNKKRKLYILVSKSTHNQNHQKL